MNSPVTKVFLFDFDGVVIDTLPIAVKVYNTLFQKHGINTQLTPTEFANLFLDNFHQCLSQIVPDDATREKILAERAAEYIRQKGNFRVFPGIKSILSQLASCGSVIIISSNDTTFIKEILDHNQITGVSQVLGGDIEKSKVKKIFAQKQQHPQAQIFYIGDTTGDIKEGKESGVNTVAVTWGFHSHQLLSHENPNFIFDKPQELIQLCPSH